MTPSTIRATSHLPKTICIGQTRNIMKCLKINSEQRNAITEETLQTHLIRDKSKADSSFETEHNNTNSPTLLNFTAKYQHLQ